MVDRLFYNYSGHHRLIYDFYTYWKRNKPVDVNSVDHIITTLEKHKKLPGYLVDYFKELKTKIDKFDDDEDEDSIIKELLVVNDYEVFKKNIDTLLNSKLKHYFGIHKKSFNF